MTTLELMQKIGTTVYVPDGKVSYAAKIIDSKLVYGEPCFLIKPVCGYGSMWIKKYIIEPFIENGGN